MPPERLPGAPITFPPAQAHEFLIETTPETENAATLTFSTTSIFPTETENRLVRIPPYSLAKPPVRDATITASQFPPTL